MNDVSSGSSENIIVLISQNDADIVIMRGDTLEQTIDLAELVKDKTIVELIQKYEKEKKLSGIF